MMHAKVLMVVPDLNVSDGVATFAMNYYRRIDHNRIKMDFACYKESNSLYNDEILENGDQIFVLPSLRRPLRHIEKCREIVNKGKYDIIHDNSLLVTIPLMRAAVKKVPVRILHSHNSKFGETRRKEIRNKLFFGMLIKTANQYAACSEPAGKLFFGEKPFSIIPNVIDTAKFMYDDQIRKDVRRREGCVNNCVIGAVGRMAHQKNLFFAFEVIERVIQYREDVVFWWVGDGELFKPAEEYIRAKHLEKYIRLFGNRTDVSELYQAMDVFFLPSKFEGFGIVCIEAQAAGLPCIVSSEFPEEVNVIGNVVFMPLSEDADLWAESVLKMIDRQRQDCSNMIDDSIFSCEKSGHVLEEFYNRLLELK